VGRNFGAGMSNGVAYVLDETECLPLRYNAELVALRPLDDPDERLVLGLVREHLDRTDSPRARLILAAWDRYRALFRKVAPQEAPPPITAPAPAAPEVAIAKGE